MTPESYCYAKRAKGFDCAAPEPGSCVECEMVSQCATHFGDEITVNDQPLKNILAPGSRACTVCKREAIPGLAYKGKALCGECAPHPHAGELMLAFSETEEEALEAGGARGGEFLDGLGKTDLATLTEEEWRLFLEKVLGGYSEFMRAEVKKYPPF